MVSFRDFNKKYELTHGKHLQETVCPSCQKVLTAWTVAHENELDEVIVPLEDDITICASCGSVNQFNADLSMRLIDDDALANMDEETKKHFALMKGFVEQKLREKNK
jgi:RNase P subunit RPR2